MPVDLDYIRSLLRDALLVLSLPPDEQRRVNGPGCLSCDLLNDFDAAARAYRGNLSGELSPPQGELLDRIDAAIVAMDATDQECFDETVLHRSSWQRLRELSREGLGLFGWAGATVQPFEEVEPGLWRRPGAAKVVNEQPSQRDS